MDEMNRAMQRPLIFIMSDNRPNFSYRTKNAEEAFFLIARMREKKERKKNYHLATEGQNKFSLFCIYYAFRFKKKSTSTAEHKHNAAIHPRALISVYSPS